MSDNQMIIKIKELQELENLIQEATTEADKIKNMLKSEMEAKEVNEMHVGQYVLRYIEVVSNRFDTAHFKTLYNDLYKAFTQPSYSKRFTISK